MKNILIKIILIIGLIFIAFYSYASPPSRQFTYTPNAVISSSEVTDNEDSIFNYLRSGVDTYADGTIVNEDISSSANIQAEKLNLQNISQSISNTGTLTNTGNVTITGSVTVGGVVNATLPAGVVMAWTTDTAPTGWLLCDGSAVSRTTYSGLFTVISTTYGTGDGSTTFNVPNLQNRTVFGKGSGTFATLASTVGAETANLAHTHTFSATSGVPSATSGATGGANQFGTNTHTHDISGTTASGLSSSQSILSPGLVLNYIIKY